MERRSALVPVYMDQVGQGEEINSILSEVPYTKSFDREQLMATATKSR